MNTVENILNRLAPGMDFVGMIAAPLGQEFVIAQRGPKDYRATYVYLYDGLTMKLDTRIVNADMKRLVKSIESRARYAVRSSFRTAIVQHALNTGSEVSGDWSSWGVYHVGSEMGSINDLGDPGYMIVGPSAQVGREIDKLHDRYVIKATVWNASRATNYEVWGKSYSDAELRLEQVLDDNYEMWVYID